MSLAAVRARADRIWQSRWLTIVFVAAFGAFVVGGFLAGRQDLRTPELPLDVQFHLVRNTTSGVTVRGRATIATVRESGMRAMLVGPSEILVHSTSEPVAMLELGLEWEEVGPGAQMQLVDEACGVTHTLGDLQHHQTMFTVPLPNPNTRLRLVPSPSDLCYSLSHYRWVTNQPLQPFSANAIWSPLLDDAVAKLELGCGWWPYQPAEPAPAGKQPMSAGPAAIPAFASSPSAWARIDSYSASADPILQRRCRGSTWTARASGTAPIPLLPVGPRRRMA
jgi:hypothetical protein